MRSLLLFGAASLALVRGAWAQAPEGEPPTPEGDEPVAPGAESERRPTRVIDPERFAGVENEEIIVQIRFDGANLADGVSGEVWSGGVRLPLSQIVTLFEFPIEADPATQRYRGWFLRENRRFEFDANTSTGLVEGRRIVAPAGSVRIVDGETYVDIAQLANWFPLDFEVSLEALSVDVSAREPLPMQQRAAREASRAQLFARFGIEEGPETPRQALPYNFFSSPFLGVRQEFQWSDAEENRYGYDLSASADIAWMTGRINLSGDNDLGVRDTRLSFGREDPYGDLPLGLHAFEIGDTFTPTAPLISRGSGGRGLSFSNAPLQRVELFDRTIVRGQLPAGYDVELYRNGALIGSQASRGDGLYEFLDVPLSYGENELRLVFYGPSGQTYQEVRRLRVGDDFLRPGQAHFSFGAVQQGEKVITPMEQVSTRVGDGNFRTILEGEFGVLQRLTLAGSAALLPTAEENDVLIGGVGARFGLGRMTLRADAASNENGALAYGGGAIGRIMGVNFGLDRVEFEEGFHSDITEDENDNISAITNARISTSIGYGRFSVPLDLSAEQRERADGQEDLEGNFRMTTGLPGGALLSNSLAYQQFGDDERLTGTVDINTEWRDWLFRGGYSYVSDDLGLHGSNYAVQLDRSVSDRSSFRLSYSESLEGGGHIASALTWRLGHASLGLGGNYDTDTEETRAQVSLSFGLGRDLEARRWVMSPDDLSETGIVRSAVYIDRNANGRRDEGDEALGNVTVGASSGRPSQTDEDGLVLLTGLEPGRPATIGIEAGSLPDPYLLPAVEAIEVVPRPGRIQVLDFPVVQTGALEGVTYFSDADGERAVGNVRLELVAADGRVVATTASEFDGFYAFERIRPGTYSVRVEPARATELGVGASLLRVTVDPDGAVQRGLDLVLREGGDAVTMVASATPEVTLRGRLEEPMLVAALRPVVADPVPEISQPSLVVAAMHPPPAAAPPAPPARPRPLNGRVVYAAGDTLVGLQHVRLRISDLGGRPVGSVLSGQGGAFELTGLAPGAYNIVPDQLDIASRGLAWDATASFVVSTDADGAPQIGDIVLRDAAAAHAVSEVAELDVPLYRPPAPIEVAELRPAQHTPAIVPAAPPSTSIQGRVLMAVDDDAMGLRGLSFDVVSHGAKVATITTNDDGDFEVGSLAPGSYELRFDRLTLASRGARLDPGMSFEIEVGGQPSVQMTPIVFAPLVAFSHGTTVSAPPNSPAPALFTPIADRRAVTGRVIALVGEASYPLGGLRLDLRSPDGAIVASVTTTQDGSFTVADVRPGRYSIVPDRMALAARTLTMPPFVLSVGAANQEGALEIGALRARSF